MYAESMPQRNWDKSFPNHEVRMAMIANKARFIFNQPSYFASWKLV